MQTTLFTDNFTRANENPLSDGGKWTVYVEAVSNPLQLVSNAAEATVLSARNTSIVTGISFPNDQWASCNIGTISALATNGSLRLRTVSSGGSYLCPFNTSSVSIQKFNGSSATTIGSSTPVTILAGDVLLFTVQGNKLSFYHNGTLIVTATDSTYSSGSPGLSDNPSSSLTNVTYSSFSAGEFQVATPTFSPIAGTYNLTQIVTVSNTDSGLSGFAMYYTTDGTTPTISSTPYSGPITVGHSLTLKVLAVATGYINSAVGSAAYTINGSGGQGNSPLGNVIFDLDSEGFPIAELQTGTDS